MHASSFTASKALSLLLCTAGAVAACSKAPAGASSETTGSTSGTTGGGTSSSAGSSTGGAGGSTTASSSSGGGATTSSSSSSGGNSCDPNGWIYLGNDAGACTGHLGEPCGWTTTNEGQGFHCAEESYGADCEPGGTTCPSGSTSSSSSSSSGAAAGAIDIWILPDYDNAKSNTGGIAGFVSRTSVTPIAISNYMNIDSGSFDTSGAEGFIDSAVAAGIKKVSISLATSDTDVPSGPQGQIAAAVAYGQQKGVTVQVRFGYEMNGNWSPSWQNGDPSIFLTTWGEVASAVQGAGGKMIWSPNIAGGTDPYNPYLPADTSTIDVIGLDFYHFNASATDLTLGATEVDDAFATIYPIVQQLGKPFVLTETAVSYFDTSGTWAVATAAEVAEKQAWLEQLTSAALLAKYPLYRGFEWFDYNKYESSEYRDFSISQQTLEATMFTSWVAANRSVVSVGP